MSEQDLIADVLGQVQPVDNSHPVAEETFDAVKAALEARARGDAEFMPGELLSTDIGSGTVIRPGDTVIFSTRDAVTFERVKQLKERLVEMLPGITPIILDGIRIEGIYREADDG